MTKKLLLALLSIAAVGTVTTRAQAQAAPAAPAPAYTLTATATAVSQYMFRGQRLGGPSWQPSVEFAAGDFTAGLWSNLPFKDKVKDSSDPEFDLYASYAFNVNKDVSIVPGFTFYDYPKAPTKFGYYRSTFEPNVAVNYTVAGVKLTPKFYYDTVLRGPTYEFTAAYALPLKDLGTELDFTGQIGTFIQRDVTNNASPSSKAWGDYWLVGVAAPFQITKQSKLTVGFAYTEGRDAYYKTGSAPRSENTYAVGRGVVTISYAFTF
ncbi:MAG: TorF family putative porin [Verrucomicrobia bacterium]|nr:TorF family putative porin [Verrucomicrobiota bacterium]